jgi:RNA polymerase sigma-70 factor (ECF subfamily)
MEAAMTTCSVVHDNTYQGWADHLLALAPDLRKFARSLCRDHDAADDLVQDTFLRAWANAHQFERGTNLGAWLFTILRNGYIGQRRKANRWVEDPEGHHAERLYAQPGQDSYLDQQDLGHALTLLPKDQQQALLLIAIQGLSYEDAALTCGCPVGTIKSRVQRARTRLAALMGFDAAYDLDPDRITKAALQLSA